MSRSSIKTSPLVHLPNLAVAHVHGREQAALAAAGVQAFQVAEIEDSMAQLRRVPNDGCLA
jgi:hypothetical protein